MSSADRLSRLTPEQRAVLLQELRSRKEATGRIARRSVSSPAPASFSQERLWFLEQLDPGQPTYNIPGAFRMRGPLDLAAFRKGVDTLVQRHEILRTTFSSVNGEPAQVILPSLSLEIPILDLQKLAVAEQNAELQRLITEHSGRSFNLAAGPLIRICLVRLAEQETVALLSMHHIICDAWSISIFVRELSRAYASIAAGQAPVLPEGAVQYADYALWQRATLAGERLQEHITYWKTQFARTTPVLELPTDRPRPPIQAFEGAKKTSTLHGSLLGEIKRLAQNEEATLFMALFAAFNTLLYRYSHQDDLLVGTPVASREKTELEHSIGLYINTLVLRTDLTGNPTFRELLHRVRTVAVDAYAHQDLPFEKLIEILQPQRDMSRPPLFQVLFSLQNTPALTFDLAGVTVTPVETYIPTAKFDLSMYVGENEEGLAVVLEYRTDLFDGETIDRMLGHFRTLLTSIAENPDQRIGDLDLLTLPERHQLLAEWNDTQRDYPADSSVHELFETQARRKPDSTAIRCGDQRITYGELNERANRLGRYLQNAGAGRGALVGICLDRSIDLIVALLGVLKAGGAYVPLDPAHPPERLAFMLQDAQVKVLLTQAGIAGVLPQHAYGVVLMNEIGGGLAEYSGDNLSAGATAADIAYVIYTSGSTGKPKGVRIPQRALVNFLCSMGVEPGLKETDIWLALTTVSFDISAAEIYLPLITGAEIALATREDASDGPSLLRLLLKSGATVLQATPATWQLLLQTAWAGSEKLKILCGGEAFPWSLAEQLIQRSGSTWNVYGPTETTVWSALGRLDAKAGAVRLAKPLANTQIYLLDPRSLKPVPSGVAGEVFIGGDGVALDYLNRPDLTAEKFIHDPFAGREGARMYRTGDLARRCKDASIEILGRVDYQVKVRGFRIELGEIEAALVEHPGLKNAVVTAASEKNGDKRLIAYVAAGRPAPTVTELRAHLKTRLPEYMAPSAFVFLDALPLTPNGKVDRRALPDPDESRPDLAVHYRAPETPVQRLVADIWGSVLNLKQVGIHDNFFELGGHSLLATRVIAQLQTKGIYLSVRKLFERPTISELCGVIELEAEKPPGMAAPALTSVSRDARKVTRRPTSQ